jgi:putative Mn2+ efflux pump MntP
MFDARRQGRILGHMCGVVGVTIGADTILGKFAQNYVRLFPYGLSGIIISLLMIVLGARVVSESQRRNFKGPPGR